MDNRAAAPTQSGSANDIGAVPADDLDAGGRRRLWLLMRLVDAGLSVTAALEAAQKAEAFVRGGRNAVPQSPPASRDKGARAVTPPAASGVRLLACGDRDAATDR
jgi:hypothetical protein